MSGQAAWASALQALNLFALDPPRLGGIVLRAHPGPVRDLFLAHLREILPADAPVRRLPPQIADDRLLGGIDLSASLQAGRPIAMRGLLAEADGGIIIAAMAERMSGATSARLCRAMDKGEISAERDGLSLRAPARFGVVALDEGIGEDEHPPASLPERLAFWVDLGSIRIGEALELPCEVQEIAVARASLGQISLPDPLLVALCETAAALGIDSMRPVLQAAHAARALAALEGYACVTQAHAAQAGQLVLAPRATRLPQAPPGEQAPQQADADAGDSAGTPDAPAPDTAAEPDAALGDKPLEEIVLEAASAAIPAHVLARLAAGMAQKSRSAALGRAGAAQKSGRRGRPIGARAGDPRQGGRLNLLATLRAAAPLQKLRRAAQICVPGRIIVRRADFRITQFQTKTQTTTIFVVDASGSAALNRLAEAKGAVELLLAECYIRRDRVALIAFRGKNAELLLPPTASLTRVKRSLASLPGGGGTPLALGIEAAVALADAVRRKGDTPVMVVLTDGQANIARDGSAGRARAGEDALAAARMARGLALAAILVDTSRRPDARAQKLAEAMGAKYLPLPYADAGRLAKAVMQ